VDVAAPPVIALARSPSRGVEVVLARGRLPATLLFVVAATLVSALVAVRVATETNVDALFLPETRHPAVSAMIQTLGTERTAVILYLVQRSFDAVVVATAITPLFVWLLGSSAVHAAARLAGVRRPYLPILVLFGYAAALTLIPASAARLALGVDRGIGPALAQLVEIACLAWLAVILYRGVRAHYAVGRNAAIRILLVALVFFYLVPLAFILLTAVAIVIAAVWLGYF
jgi:hypothetical protein